MFTTQQSWAFLALGEFLPGFWSPAAATDDDSFIKLIHHANIERFIKISYFFISLYRFLIEDSKERDME